MALPTVRRRRIPFANINTVIALLLAFLLLASSYWALDEDAHPFWHDLTHEIGFALIVAITIWGTYEFFTQAESEEQWNERIENITRNVFLGVLKRNFPSAFIAEANLLVLEHTFIRSDLHVTYTMSDGVYKDRAGKDQTFVKLNAVARFKVKNVGNKKETLPIQIGLPNPLIDEMKSTCKVNGVTIKRGGKEERCNLADAEVAFREEMKNDDRFQVPFKVESIDVEPNDEVELIFDYAMAKEAEDTEIFQTLYPAASVIITIVDQGSTKRVVRARSLHRTPLENDTSAYTTGTYIFKLDQYLLPHQGYAIWWKRLPPQPAAPTPAAAAPPAAGGNIRPGGTV
jgi:hypothetical protein